MRQFPLAHSINTERAPTATTFLLVDFPRISSRILPGHLWTSAFMFRAWCNNSVGASNLERTSADNLMVFWRSSDFFPSHVLRFRLLPLFCFLITSFDVYDCSNEPRRFLEAGNSSVEPLAGIKARKHIELVDRQQCGV